MDQGLQIKDVQKENGEVGCVKLGEDRAEAN